MERAAAVRQSNLKGCMLKVHFKIKKTTPMLLKLFQTNTRFYEGATKVPHE
jgi:hypothetical protein